MMWARGGLPRALAIAAGTPTEVKTFEGAVEDGRGAAAVSGSGDVVRDPAVEVRGEMVGEIAGVVPGAVDQGGLAAAEELQAHHIQAG